MTLSNGRVVPCDLLLSTCGIVPNDELPRAAGLEVNRGIVLDGERLAGFISITDLARALEVGVPRRRRQAQATPNRI